MKLKQLVDRAEDYDTENLEEINVSYYSEAQTEEIREALKTISAACIQSGMRLVKIQKGETQEFAVIDASDGEPAAIQSLTQQLLDHYDVELGSHEQNPDVLYAIAELPEDLKEVPTPEENLEYGQEESDE